MEFIDVLQKNGLKQFVSLYRNQLGLEHDLIISRYDIVSNLQHMPPLGKNDHAVLSFCCDVKTVSASHAIAITIKKVNMMNSEILWTLIGIKHCYQKITVLMKCGIC